MSIPNNPEVSRFTGFCFDYDKYRPTPPAELIELAVGWSGKNIPALVVDLGCGTGLSTRPWATHAEKVIGIDPSLDMLDAARKATTSTNVTYVEGFGDQTFVATGSVDIVTCSTSIHWMEPVSTLREIDRILAQRGLLVVYDYYYPVFMNSPELTRFYEVWRKNTIHLENEVEKLGMKKWQPQMILEHFTNSEVFGYTRKHYMHSRLDWTADDVRGYFRAHSVVHLLTKMGYDDEKLLFNDLEKLLLVHGNSRPFAIQQTYSIFMGLKA